MKRFDVIEATFNPRRTDDLKPGVAAAVGRRGYFVALWVVEEDEGVYAGQWAMGPTDEGGSKYGGFTDVFPFGWTPLCDLVIVPPTCARCGQEYQPHRMCPRRTAAGGIYCWPEGSHPDTLQLEPGLGLRPGSAPAAPLLDIGKDPYTEDP